MVAAGTTAVPQGHAITVSFTGATGNGHACIHGKAVHLDMTVHMQMRGSHYPDCFARASDATASSALLIHSVAMRSVPECSCSMVAGPSHTASRAALSMPRPCPAVTHPLHRPAPPALVLMLRSHSRRAAHACASTSQAAELRRPEYIPGRIDDPRCAPMAGRVSA